MPSATRQVFSNRERSSKININGGMVRPRSAGSRANRSLLSEFLDFSEIETRSYAGELANLGTDGHLGPILASLTAPSRQSRRFGAAKPKT